MSTDFELIMFDLDGTLVETAPEITDAINDTLASVGRDAVTQHEVERWVGHGTRQLLVRALAHSASAASPFMGPIEFEGISRRFDEFYLRRCGTRSRLYPHVMEVLQQLCRDGVKLAVVTNKDARFTEPILRLHGLAPLLEMVVSGDTVGAKKPDPDGLLHCMSQLSICARDALFVGDSTIDMQAARQAGVAFWAVDYGYNGGEPIGRLRPLRLLTDLRQLLSSRPNSSTQ